ncbi:MAG TPA: glycosyltransferase family 39 protein [Candidatus Saccharimonadales bacterium]|nr:glycosyltransferase family 39 protein [Candidatus Saccharimonadales bacterium]
MKKLIKNISRQILFFRKNDNFSIPSILVVLTFAFLVRIILSPFGTLTLDQNTFIAWSTRLLEVGFSKFYFGGWSDYLPGYLYILDVLAHIAKTNLIPTIILYKLPAILSDVGTGYLIYRIVKNLKNEKWGVIAAALYVFNPAIITNSTLWGQVDGLVAFFSLLSLCLISENMYLSAFSLAFGTLIKPQMAVVSLIIFLIMIRDRWNVRKIVIYILTSGIVFFGLFIPFSNGTNIFNFIVGRLNISLNQYPYTSVNAFNFWQIVGGWKADNVFSIVGGIAFLVLFFGIGTRFLKQRGGEYILLSFAYAASFLFMTRMHERHMLPTFAPLTIAVALNPALIFTLIGFSFIYTLNIYWAWNWVTNNFADVFGDFLIKLLSLINVLLISVFIIPEKIMEKKMSFFENIFKRTATSGEVKKFGEPSISSKKIKVLFIGVVIFASLTRFYNLWNPQVHYFDEVYHAFTAQEMLHGNTKAWEWWNTNPAGFAYEWTHPPLAKLGMVVGMRFLGEGPFGWRLPGAMLGVGSVILIYFLAKEIFDDELVGLIAAAIFSLDGLPLVLSRIGMNDSYVLFFALASILAYLRKRNFWAAVFFGLSLASKWSALWVVPIIFVAHFVFKRKLTKSYVFFIVVPPIIYISTYFPLFTNKQIQSEYVANTGYSLSAGKTGIIPLDMFIDTQKQMWWYHTRLKATHPYTSPWYSWPVMLRPVYLYTSDEVNDQVARIYVTGNPAVFWGGAIAIGITAYLAIKERNRRLGFVVFSYLIFFAPWALSPRIMFLYHYLPSVPFLAIALAYTLRRFKDFLPGYFMLAVGLFVYFYPHFVGLTIPLGLDTSYYWLRSWR